MRLTPMVAGPGRHSEAHVFANASGWHRTSALRTLRKRGHRHTDGSSFRHSPQGKEPSDEDASKPNSSIPDIGDRVFDVPAYVGVVGSPFVAPPSVVAVGARRTGRHLAIPRAARCHYEERSDVATLCSRFAQHDASPEPLPALSSRR